MAKPGASVFSHAAVVLGAPAALLALLQALTGGPPFLIVVSVLVAVVLLAVAERLVRLHDGPRRPVVAWCAALVVSVSAGTCLVVQTAAPSTRGGFSATAVDAHVASEVPRCRAVVFGTAPHLPEHTIWVAHREVGTGAYYLAPADWEPGSPGTWSAQLTVGAPHIETSQRFEFVAFSAGPEATGFLAGRRSPLPDGDHGLVTFAALPPGVDDSGRIEATRLPGDGGECP